MKILVAHNYHREAGGEDVVFESESMLLERSGHTVIRFCRHSSEFDSYTCWRKLTLGLRAVWAWDTARELALVINHEKPDIVHVHNAYPLLSRSVYCVCRKARIPVVQTLHNYRRFCPSATLYRDGRICTECTKGFLPWPATFHRCCRESRALSIGIPALLSAQRFLDKWEKCQPDYFLALTEASRKRFIEFGLPASRIGVKPNFLAEDPGMRESGLGEYGLFAGRFAPEKGIFTLLSAMSHLDDVPMMLIGNSSVVRQPMNGRIGFSDGWVSREEVLARMQKARFVVVPSEWYEPFGLIVIEAFACGVPVIASRRGSLAEMVEEGRTGLHFDAGDANDLAARIRWAWDHPERMLEMGRCARQEYFSKYTAEVGLRALTDIYGTVLNRKSSLDMPM
jgi:glycosyltransferase involved in cell wall biosynthesis